MNFNVNLELRHQVLRHIATEGGMDVDQEGTVYDNLHDAVMVAYLTNLKLSSKDRDMYGTYEVVTTVEEV
jgi:hypothetical protein